ncbi:MAG: hypothetical protein LE180_00750, partial [Endomicrobium sp.]|uniref:hypothetical protein n=1 Tax=Candidatus Endomicrobiellum pyrsonymphae TaxID=1408203 RepID=UPI0035795089|nr:hypothetical protein [Endomicrobium sp.]
KTVSILNTVENRINQETKTEQLTPEIAWEAVELAEQEYSKKYKTGYSDDWWENSVLSTYSNEDAIARMAKKSLSQDIQNEINKYVPAYVMVTRLATLRKMGQQWDTEGIRQRLSDRKLTINEGVALNVIMTTLGKRILNYTLMTNMYAMQEKDIPEGFSVGIF